MAMRAKTTKTKSTQLELVSIGVDIGKDVFHIVGFDRDGKIALRRKFKRLALTKEFEKLPCCIVGMEACLSAHFVSRQLRALGFKPRIIRKRSSNRICYRADGFALLPSRNIFCEVGMGENTLSDKQLLNLDAAEGRTLDRSKAQLGQLQQEKKAFNDARQEAMKTASYHPVMWNRKQRGIAG